MDNLPLCFLFTALLIQVLYYGVLIYFWQRTDEAASPDIRPTLSILICARDEAENLSRNLPAVLRQNYPGLEVLVVDDGSTDNTAKTLEQLKDQYSSLKTLHISPDEKQGSGKKFALRRGVEAAMGEVVLLTDADCRPASPLWAQKMVQALGEKDIVLGLSPFDEQPGFLPGLAVYETAITALQYIGYAKAGSPYMGVGRNLGFRKDIFRKKNWTEAEMQLPSGDDDLFIQTEAHAGNTATCMAPDAFTFSKSPQNFSGWFRQKKRHLSTGYTYHLQHRILLGVFLLSKACVYGMLLFIGNFQLSVAIFTCCAILLTGINYWINNPYKLNPRWYLSPLFDPAYVFSIIFTGIASRLSPNRSWK